MDSHEEVQVGRAVKADEDEVQQRYEKPKLEYIEPKLVEHGEVEEKTSQFIGNFSPP